MTWFLTFKEAWRNLLAHKLRSWLSVLGIAIGAASIVAMLTTGEIAKNKTLAEFQSLGTDLMAVNLSVDSSQTGGDAYHFLSLEQWQQLAEKNTNIRLIAPYGFLASNLSFHGKAIDQASAIASDKILFSLLPTQLIAGRLISPLDKDNSYCIVGADLAKQLALTPTLAIGQLIQVQNVFFTVIGVLAPWQGNSFFEGDLNNSLIMNVEATIKLPVRIVLNSALLKLNANSDIDSNQQQIQQQIKQFNSHLSVNIRSAKALQQTMLRQKQTLSLMLGLIGSIVLLVGGIGIMNVMLVSVTERKKEIGLRLAIGAKHIHIRALFLAEASILGAVGGLSGSLLGEIITWIIGFFTDWDFILYWPPLLLGLSLSLLTSIFFGFYPAYQASRLNPIEVLRTA